MDMNYRRGMWEGGGGQDGGNKGGGNGTTVIAVNKIYIFKKNIFSVRLLVFFILLG